MPPADPWSIQLGVVWGFVNRTKTASDKLYRGLPNGPGISNAMEGGKVYTNRSQRVADPWSSDKGNQISSDYRTALVGPGISGPWIQVKPWCTGKQLPLGFNPTGPV